MTSRALRRAFGAFGLALVLATPVAAHGLHQAASGALHGVMHALPVLAVVVGIVVAYRLIRSRSTR